MVQVIERLVPFVPKAPKLPADMDRPEPLGQGDPTNVLVESEAGTDVERVLPSMATAPAAPPAAESASAHRGPEDLSDAAPVGQPRGLAGPYS